MEQWKQVYNALNYEVSDLGRVRNATTKYVLKGRPLKAGYLQVSIKINGKFINQYIHRLVAKAFLKNEDVNKTEVNRIDGVKSNNKLYNLEWVTPKQNMKHARENKLLTVTSNRKVGKFTKDGELIMTFDSIVEGAKFEGTTRGSIDKVVQGKRGSLYGFVWKYI